MMDSAMKLKLLVLSAGVIAGFYYADFSTDVGALQVFWSDGKKQYFVINVLAMMLAAGYYSLLVGEAIPRDSFFSDGYGKAALMLLAFVQLLPALCLIVCFFLLLFRHNEEFLREELKRFGILALLACSSLAEALIEAVGGALVQLYSYLRDDDYGEKDLSTLRLSILISILSLVKGFSELDQKDKMLRSVDSATMVTGTAPKTSMAFFAVVLWRAVSIAGRIVIFPLFQLLTRDQLALPVGHDKGGNQQYVPCGAVLLLLLDVGCQYALIWYYTRNPQKLGWSLANCISPVEPILHGGDHPIFTTPPVVVCGVHFAEGALAAIFAVLVHGGGVLQAVHDKAHPDNETFLVLCVACVAGQWPLLMLIRAAFAYKHNPEDSLAAMLGNEGHNSKFFDEADLQAPAAIFMSNFEEMQTGVVPEIQTGVVCSESLELLHTMSRGKGVGPQAEEWGNRLMWASLRGVWSPKKVDLRSGTPLEVDALGLASVVAAQPDSLESFSLCYHKALGEDVQRALCDSLRGARSLKAVDLYFRGVPKEDLDGFLCLVKDLAAQPSLEQFNVRICPGDLSDAAYAALLRALLCRQASRLTVGLTRCGAGEVTTRAAGELLRLRADLLVREGGPSPLKTKVELSDNLRIPKEVQDELLGEFGDDSITFQPVY